MQYYNRKNKRREKSFKEIPLKDGTVIGVFQGSKGQNPDFDILLKYKEAGKRVRTPAHIHWAIDLLIKKQHNPTLTLEFTKYLRDMWDEVQRFTCKTEQQNCDINLTKQAKLEKYSALNEFGNYKVEFMSAIIELMIAEEKTGNNNAHMFKDTFDALLNGADIFSIVSKATYRGR